MKTIRTMWRIASTIFTITGICGIIMIETSDRKEEFNTLVSEL